MRERNLNLALGNQFSIINGISEDEISVKINDLNKIVGRQTKKSICLPTIHIDFESAFCSSQYLFSNFTNSLAYFLMKYQEEIRKEITKREIRERTKSHQPKIYRTGSYPRTIYTTAGPVNFRVLRINNRSLSIPGIRKWQRFAPEYETNLLFTYLSGLTSNKLSLLYFNINSHRTSRQKIVTLTKQFKKSIDHFHSRKIDKAYKYILFDAVYVKINTKYKPKLKRTILCAVGITSDNQVDLIDFKVTLSESEARWNKFIGELYYRGLNKSKPLLIVSDKNPALVKSIVNYFPYSHHQICIFHHLQDFRRNLKKELTNNNNFSKTLLSKIMKSASKIYTAPSLKTAKKLAKKFYDEFHKLAPHSFKLFFKDFDETLNYFHAPPPDRKLVKTSNLIEGFFRELKRKNKSRYYFKSETSFELAVLFNSYLFNPKFQNKNSLSLGVETYEFINKNFFQQRS